MIDVLIRNWLSWVLGSLYVFVCLIGFCVVIMRNGCLVLCVMLLIVICDFFMILSSVDWVFGDVWLILLVSMIDVKIGFLWNLKWCDCWL